MIDSVHRKLQGRKGSAELRGDSWNHVPKDAHTPAPPPHLCSQLHFLSQATEQDPWGWQLLLTFHASTLVTSLSFFFFFKNSK